MKTIYFDFESSRSLKKKPIFELNNNSLYETIIGVYDNEGKPFFAPVGLRVLDYDEQHNHVFEAKIFTSSRIYSFLKDRQECTIHFPNMQQIEFFFLGFRDAFPGIEEALLSSSSVFRASSVEAPCIEIIANKIEARSVLTQNEAINDEISQYNLQESTRGIFKLTSLKYIIDEPSSVPFSRYPGVLIEFLVEASRVHCIENNKEVLDSKIKKLRSLLDIMTRVSPDDAKNGFAIHLIKFLTGAK